MGLFQETRHANFLDAAVNAYTYSISDSQKKITPIFLRR